MTSALLVIDVQNGFFHPHGSFGRAGSSRERVLAMLPNLIEAVDAFRALGLPVFFTMHEYSEGYPESGRNALAVSPAVVQRRGLLRGTWDAAAIDELRVGPDDVLVSKCRYDAFYSTELDLLLRVRSVDRLLVVGAATNQCVESSVRSAAHRDYAVVAMSDCLTATNEEAHERGLQAMRNGIAHVMPWRDALARERSGQWPPELYMPSDRIWPELQS